MGKLRPGPAAADLPAPSACLVVLDGWGLAPPGPGNAVSLAVTPVFDELWSTYPHCTLTTHGRSVGLPDGQMGNSEVGHLNLGAGAIVAQDLTRIDDAVEDGSFFDNPALKEVYARGRSGGRLHLMGLVSDGGVHSGWRHLEACIEMAAREEIPDLVLHAFTDGRDTPPTAGAAYLREVDDWLAAAAAAGCGAARIGTISGRYYAMDRDRRWDRIECAYDAIVHGRGNVAVSAAEAIERSYAAGVTDEFVEPVVVGEESRVRAGDGILFFNFRPDRARELTMALADPEFGEFDRGGAPAFELTTMTEYRAEWAYPVAFAPRFPRNVIADLIAARGRRQLHVAETEKYAHVTYFFNGGREGEHEGEDRILVPSPREVPTYDHKPEMSAAAATDEFCGHWSDGDYEFGIVNFANPDMVGHTGVIEAARRAVETVDTCLGRVVDAVHATGGACVITADHGNADQMLEPDGSPNTAHTKNPVPLIVTVSGLRLAQEGILADVSPTVVSLLGMEKPAEMTGTSLVVGGKATEKLSFPP